MALPRILQKLFQNDGAGPRLLRAIMPEGVVFSVNGNSPDANGNVAVAAGDAMEADILSAADKAVDGTITNFGSVDVANLVSAVASVEAGLDGKLPVSTAHVVETWSDGVSWYRKWSDGWIEQGGNDIGSSFAVKRTITFPTSFTSTPTIVLGSKGVASEASYEGGIDSITTTSFTYIGTGNFTGSVNSCSWYACGY